MRDGRPMRLLSQITRRTTVLCSHTDVDLGFAVTSINTTPRLCGRHALVAVEDFCLLEQPTNINERKQYRSLQKFVPFRVFKQVSQCDSNTRRKGGRYAERKREEQSAGGVRGERGGKCGMTL